MDISTFNVEAFSSGQFEGANDTRFVRLEPKEYQAVIVGPFGEDKKTRIRTSEKQALGLERLPTVRQTVFLDLTAQGGLDMGPFKNADLGRLREALNLNAEGQRWSFQEFIGKAAKIKVEQKPNEKDPANPYTNVTAVTKL